MYLGDIGKCRFYIGKRQYKDWKHTLLIIDVIDGYGGGTFSLEGPEGKAFHIRTQVFSDAELAELQIALMIRNRNHARDFLRQTGT